MIIRPYESGDQGELWAILEPVIRAGEVFAFPRDLSAAGALERWTGAGKRVFSAVDEGTGRLLGCYYLRANQEGGGAHVSNCGYVVSPEARGRGVAAAMCEHSLAEAAAAGFRAMQFNFVVSTNRDAVHLWRKLGFAVVGTLPGAFAHPRLGYVDVYVMYRTL